MPSSLKKNPDFLITRYDDIQIPLYFLNIRKDINAAGLCYKVRKFSAELGKIIYNRFVKRNSIENID